MAVTRTEVVLKEILALAVLAACMALLAACGAAGGAAAVPATEWKATTLHGAADAPPATLPSSSA